MIKRKKTDIVCILVICLSLACHFVMYALYRTRLDEKQLIVRGDPMLIVLWVCVAVAAVLIIAAEYSGRKLSHYQQAFERSFQSVMGHGLAAACILFTAHMNSVRFEYKEILEKIWVLSGWVSGVLLLWAAWSKLRGKTPFYGIYCVCSVFFAFHLIVNYQNWCANPQLTDYVFSFLGAAAMMLFAYQQAAFCIDRGNSRQLRITGLLAALFCLPSIWVEEEVILYLGCYIWAVTGLSKPQPLGKKNSEGIQ
ncbi:MAG: hypothetical protein J6V25_02515 [Oscillospiraceae bacterium]|nr:hypothetical protein [Oscillospiraceae bacterium]